LKPLDLFG
jgi:hypothetical protein